MFAKKEKSDGEVLLFAYGFADLLAVRAIAAVVRFERKAVLCPLGVRRCTFSYQLMLGLCESQTLFVRADSLMEKFLSIGEWLHARATAILRVDSEG